VTVAATSPAVKRERRRVSRFAGESPPVRYMGTKRALAPIVREALASLSPDGRVADLFSGMGSVTATLAPDYPVLANDALSFTTAFARARFLDEGGRGRPVDVARRLRPAFQECYAALCKQFADRLRAEKQALAEGSESLRVYMEEAPHAGTSPEWAASATASRPLRRASDYRLIALYFSGAYFSTRQALELDALRYAIDTVSDLSRDWLLSAWLAAAGAVVNAPGHVAQFLKPNGEAVYQRVSRQWRRSIWETFVDRLGAVQPVGTRKWRAQNRVTNLDVFDLLESAEMDCVSMVYADPPYTKDQYSRFYHVYETMYMYDFPDSVGAGRYRSDRFHTTFSALGTVRASFSDLVSRLAERGKPLVLSYPSHGALQRAHVSLSHLLRKHYHVARNFEIMMHHSTLGASSGENQKLTREKVYVCIP